MVFAAGLGIGIERVAYRPLRARMRGRRSSLARLTPLVTALGMSVLLQNLAQLLFTARFLQGVVSGVVFSVASAWVAELSAASGEGAGGRRAAVAMTAGFSLGPLTSGLLGQFAPAPTVLPYLLHTVLVGVGLALAVRVPETVALHPGGRRTAVGSGRGALSAARTSGSG